MKIHLKASNDLDCNTQCGIAVDILEDGGSLWRNAVRVDKTDVRDLVTKLHRLAYEIEINFLQPEPQTTLTLPEPEFKIGDMPGEETVFVTQPDLSTITVVSSMAAYDVKEIRHDDRVEYVFKRKEKKL